MFVGYSECHAPDTYRLYIMATKRIVNARDILWTNDKYITKKESKPIDEDPKIDTDKWIEDEDKEQESNEIIRVDNQKR